MLAIEEQCASCCLVHYLARATIANVTKRLLSKIESRERLANMPDMSIRSLHTRVGASPRVPSLKEKSAVVIPRSIDNDGMIEIHVKYHRRRSSEFVKPRPIKKAKNQSHSRILV